MTRTMLLGRMVETTRTVLLLCHVLRDSRLAVFFVLAVVGTAERAGVGPSTPVYTGSNCTVCRGVTQGFVDLHTEWPRVRDMILQAQVRRGDGGLDEARPQLIGDDNVGPVTYEAAIERFCAQSFLSDNQQRVCYSITPFASEVAKWLSMGVPPERVCLKLGKRNPCFKVEVWTSAEDQRDTDLKDTCFDAREAERTDATVLHWRNRPAFIPEGVECSLEHRNSFEPRWVLLD